MISLVKVRLTIFDGPMPIKFIKSSKNKASGTLDSTAIEKLGMSVLHQLMWKIRVFTTNNAIFLVRD